MSSKSNLTTSQKNSLIAQFKAITGANTTDSTRFMKKYNYGLERAIDGYYSDPMAMSNTASSSEQKGRDKKLGDIWESYRDAPNLVTIEGTMNLVQDLDIDPSTDPVLFCLAYDLGSKVTGEWEKEPWIKGWRSIGSDIDSIQSMKAALPRLRKNLVSDPEYFKKVYTHVFELAKAAGSRTLVLDSALGLWEMFILPALNARPSALGHLITDSTTGAQTPDPSGAPQFTGVELQMWLDFQKEKARAVSKDTWIMLLEFIRVIDKDFKEHDEDSAWPSTIDDFVEYVRQKKGTA